MWIQQFISIKNTQCPKLLNHIQGLGHNFSIRDAARFAWSCYSINQFLCVYLYIKGLISSQAAEEKSKKGGEGGGKTIFQSNGQLRSG